ncbi:MAG: sulfite exporter TauE/SafE family protein [Pseudomonadota bacterium]
MSVDLPFIAFVLGAGFIGGLVRGYSGFGFAMSAVPLLSIGISPALAVPAVLLHELAIGLCSLRAERAVARSPVLRILGLGTLIGTPLGLTLLAAMPEQPMRIAIALTLLVSVAAIWGAGGHRLGLGRGVLGAAGVVSGLLNGATAMSGPPAVLVLLASPLAAAEVRGVLIYFIALSAALAVVLSLATGLQNAETLTIAALMTPGVVLGALSGVAAFRFLPHAHYRTIALLVLLAIALLVLLAIALVSLAGALDPR